MSHPARPRITYACTYGRTHYKLEDDNGVDRCYCQPLFGTEWQPISQARFNAARTRSAAQAQRHNRNDFSQG